MPPRTSGRALNRIQTRVHRALLSVLGVGVVALLIWQTTTAFRNDGNSAEADSIAITNTTDVQRGAYTDLFALMHRAVPEGNILAEATWYTTPLIKSLTAYTERSTHQNELARYVAAVDPQDALTFSVLLTSEVDTVRDVPVGEHARVRDDAGAVYPILAWERLDPLALSPTGSQQQEAGVLVVSTTAENGESVWTNSGTLSLILSGIDDGEKVFTWRKELATDINFQ